MCLKVITFTVFKLQICFSEPLKQNSYMFKCVSMSRLCINTSSRYTKVNCNPLITWFISLRKYAGAWLKPKGHLVNSNLSKGVTKADLALASGDSFIWWYPLLRSKVEKICDPLNWHRYDLFMVRVPMLVLLLLWSVPFVLLAKDCLLPYSLHITSF